jgi:hypothetical protein
MNGITVPAGDVSKMPVIGLATTRSITATDMNTLEKLVIEPQTYEVVAITEDDQIYVTNVWYKPGVPLVLHTNIVEYYEPIKK